MTSDTIVVVAAAIAAVSSVVVLVVVRILVRPCACERLATEIDAAAARAREVRLATERLLREMRG